MEHQKKTQNLDILTPKNDPNFGLFVIIAKNVVVDVYQDSSSNYYYVNHHVRHKTVDMGVFIDPKGMLTPKSVPSLEFLSIFVQNFKKIRDKCISGKLK